MIDVGVAGRSQIREFVFQISALYHHNAFHNFEHASHVAMSASKLLRRIIAPDDIKRIYYDNINSVRRGSILVPGTY
jgi:hypothetical protein